MSEEEILNLLRRLATQGNEAQSAMRQLHAEFRSQVYAFALGRMRRAEDAEEVVVETFLEVWRKAATFRGDSRFTTWLLGIAKYKILNHRRGDAPAHEDVDELGDVLEDEDAVDGFALIAQAQRASGVRRCLGTLKAEHRECLQLVYFDELSVRDVAAVQGVDEGTVKSRCFHARQKIKKCLSMMLRREGEDA